MSVGTLSRGAHRPAFTRPAWLESLGAEGAIVAALTAVAAVVRFVHIAHQGFWFDEGNTAQLISFSPGPMLTLIKHYESTPPLYYCIVWVWGRVFDFGEAGLRSFSAVVGVLTVPVAYVAGAKLISKRAGVIAAALTTFNPYLIWYSQEARAYELVVLLTGLSLVAFAFALREPSGRAVAAWGITCALALATEYYSALIIVPEALWLLYSHRRDPRLRGLAITIGLLVLWSAPLLWFAIEQNGTGHASWIAPLPFAPRIEQIVPQFLVGFQLPLQQVLTRIAEAAALIALLLLAVRSAPEERRGGVLALSIAVGGFVLELLLIGGGIDDLLSRNVISLWMPAAVAVAGGFAAVRARTLGIVCTVVLCAIGLTGAVAVAADRNYQRPDWRGVARVLGARPAPGVTRGILIQHYRDLLPLKLYMPGLVFWPHVHQGPAPNDYMPVGTLRLSEFDIVAISAPRVNLCWWGSACNLTPRPLQRSYLIPGMHVAWIRHIYQFTIMRLVASHPVPVNPQAVARALTVTTLRQDDLLRQP